MKLMSFAIAISALLICAVAAADLHPIVELQTGYLFGATADGKWMKTEQAAKALKAEITYRIYGLTQSFGEAKGDKPKPSEEDVCSDVLTVSLSPRPENGVIALAAPWNALPRKPRVMDTTQQVYVEAVRDFLKTKGIEEPKVKIDNIIRVDLGRSVNQRNELLRKGRGRADEIYGWQLFDGVVAAGRLWKGGNTTGGRRIYPKAYNDDERFNAPNAYKVIAVLDLDGDGKMEVVVASNYYEGEATTIYRCNPKKIEELLSVSCGA
jgi:FG-GAP repeat